MLIIAAIIALFAAPSPPTSESRAKAEPLSIGVQTKAPAPISAPSSLPDGNQYETSNSLVSTDERAQLSRDQRIQQ